MQDHAEQSGTVRVAVVEDDAEFRDAILIPVLRQAGFQVAAMGSALELYRDLLSSTYDLVLLDLRLPDEDGVAIARRLRERSPSLGMVMLSGAGEQWRHRALEAGVDAFVAKPADLDEVVLLLRNLAGRVARERSARADAGAAGWRLEAGGWRLVAPGGRSLDMAMAERSCMLLLADNAGKPVSREALIARLSGRAEDFDPHRLEMLLYRLRRKCREQLGEELPLKAVRGVGYVLVW